ncbi:hypothetical protein TNCV_3875721 [Trichonephila clavipes]|uniref:Uncharacterized protein n=1 Tax=Trichonephila clavipes TaxID=2585209 RepID=A0A8X6SRX0_TRICX|nr:hypothetical protein TNCV_3875721 [Trichonephila clavipes]
MDRGYRLDDSIRRRSWKTRCGPITGYLLLGPQGFEKCGAQFMETVHRDRNNGPSNQLRSQKGSVGGRIRRLGGNSTIGVTFYVPCHRTRPGRSGMLNCSSKTNSNDYQGAQDDLPNGLMFIISRPVCYEFEPRAAEDPSSKGGCSMPNLLRLKSTPIGVVRKLGKWVTTQVLSSTLYHGSKL